MKSGSEILRNKNRMSQIALGISPFFFHMNRNWIPAHLMTSYPSILLGRPDTGRYHHSISTCWTKTVIFINPPRFATNVMPFKFDTTPFHAGDCFLRETESRKNATAHVFPGTALFPTTVLELVHNRGYVLVKEAGKYTSSLSLYIIFIFYR